MSLNRIYVQKLTWCVSLLIFVSVAFAQFPTSWSYQDNPSLPCGGELPDILSEVLIEVHLDLNSDGVADYVGEISDPPLAFETDGILQTYLNNGNTADRWVQTEFGEPIYGSISGGVRTSVVIGSVCCGCYCYGIRLEISSTGTYRFVSHVADISEIVPCGGNGGDPN